MGRTDSVAARVSTLARPLPMIRSWQAALLDWRPAALIGICVALIVLCAQAPFRYSFEVGRGTGPASDLPFMQGFHEAEGRENHQGFRWSKAQEARIEIPGVGRRGVIADLAIVSHRAQWLPGAPPTVLTLRSGEITPFSFPLRLQGAHYHIYLPPAALADGTLRLNLATDVWQKPGDNRDELGVAIGQRVRIAGAQRDGLLLPDRAMLLAWPAALALLWLALRILRFPPPAAFLLLLPLAIGIPLLSLLDAPRLGFGSLWALQFGLLSLLAAIVCAWAIPPLLARLGAHPDLSLRAGPQAKPRNTWDQLRRDVGAPEAILRWLALLVVLSFALKYVGRLYPDSMPGDIQLHVNRYLKTVMGEVYILAKHRGLPFPFPTGSYLLLAPLTLLGLDIRFLLQFSAGLFEATTVLLLYLIVVRTLGSPRLGLLSGAIYAVTSAGFMTTWFAFETQVTAQWFSIALLALLAIRWPRYDDRSTWWLLLLLLALVFLGHIGLFINVTLLGLLVAPVLWLRTRDGLERRAAGWLLFAGLIAVLFAVLFFYSAFTGVIAEQLGGVAAGGLNGATGRNPIPRTTTLWVTWQGGLITHFGFFPVLLTIPGVLLLPAWLRRSALPPLLGVTLFISLSQAVLPLITLSSITTRWLMFSAWAIAVAGALGLAQLRRRGLGARLISIAMALYVGWLTIALWIAALALRQPPIEPF